MSLEIREGKSLEISEDSEDVPSGSQVRPFSVFFSFFSNLMEEKWSYYLVVPEDQPQT